MDMIMLFFYLLYVPVTLENLFLASFYVEQTPSDHEWNARVKQGNLNDAQRLWNPIGSDRQSGGLRDLRINFSMKWKT